MVKSMKKKIIVISVCFCVVLFGTVIAMDHKTNKDSQLILEDSVQSQLMSILYSAQEIIDPDRIADYNNEGDQDEAYYEVEKELRLLAEQVEAEYIYIIKKIQYEEYIFIFDTDTEDLERFDVIDDEDMQDIYVRTYTQKTEQVEYMLEDQWGSHNIGAMPIFDSAGAIVGILCVDLTDVYLTKNIKSNNLNTIILSVVILATLLLMLFFIVTLLRKLHKAQDELEKMAHYDVITQLPNRQYLLEQLNLITSSNTVGPFALVFVDLDNFKSVNDNAGHDAGDELLKHIANYLNESLGDSKAFRPAAGMLNITARIGGDEFILIAPHIKNNEDAEKFAKKLLDGFRTEKIDKYIDRYNVGLSIGIALYPEHSENYHVLIKYADTAMYCAKKDGKNCFRIYEDGMNKLDD